MASARQSAVRIVRTLQAEGFEAYLAGGCVRDLLLEKQPKDYDIATSAEPEDIRKTIRNTRSIGKAFGVIQAHVDGHAFEIATFRTDHEYHDGRRPSSVTFADARGDAARRDFTVNAMFFDPIAGLYIDHVGGMRDIGDRLIRTVGMADERFREDHLRMLRGVRFAHGLNFTLEHDTSESIRKNARLIERISAERIQNELFRILTESLMPGAAVLTLHSLQLLAHILPATSRSHSPSQLKRTAAILNAMSGQPLQSLLTALLLRTGAAKGAPVTSSATQEMRLKTAGELRLLRVSKAMRNHILEAQQLYWQLHRVRNTLPRELLPDLAAPHADTAFAILAAALPSKARTLSRIRSDVMKLLRRSPVSGTDLKAAGVKPGPAMARLLKESRILQCEGMKKREILAQLTRS